MSSKIPDTTTLHALLQHAPGFIVFTDPDMNILYLNRTAHGYSLEETIGTNYLSFLTPEQGKKVKEAFQLAQETNEEQHVESFLDTPVNGRQWMSTRISLLRGDDDELIGFVNITTEVTEQKRAEQELDSTRKELLEASHRAGMAEVATGVLHNVGNVLNSVNVSASEAVRQLEHSRLHLLGKAVDKLSEHADDLAGFLTGDAKGKKFLSLLEQLATELDAERTRMRQELDRLITHVGLMRSTVEAQQNLATANTLLETVDVGALVDRVLSLFQIDIENRAIALSTDVVQGDTRIDRQGTMQILANLVRNAIEALDVVEDPDHKPRIQLRAVFEDDDVVFTIEDNGQGIEPEHLDHIFEHGFTTKPKGHGFGLHTSAVSAQSMNGSLRGDSAGKGQGARFRLSLPRYVDGASAGSPSEPGAAGK